MPFQIEPLDIVIIVIVALLVFGPARLPDIGRSLGKTISEFRSGTKDMVEEFTGQVSRPIREERSSSPSPQPPTGNLCARCAAANVPDAIFCNKCGARLGAQPPVGNLCARCGMANVADAAFCNHCGARLEGQTHEQPTHLQVNSDL